MKHELKKTLVLLPLLAALAACGGGGSDSSPVDTTRSADGAGTGQPATDGDTKDTPGTPTTPAKPEVEELFHLSPRGTTARYLLLGTSLQSTGALETLEQQPMGGVVAMNAHTLTGPDLSVADIAGDETFAQGRWAEGTALAAGSTSTLGGARNAAYHYVVHLAATHFPAGGTLRCDAGTFTRPTVISNPSAPALGVATGSAALSFNDAGAVVDVSLTATAGHRTGTVSTTGRTIAPGASAVTGNFFSQGDGMMLTLGDSGNGKFRIIAAYEVTAGGDAAYRGIATFLCTR